MTDRNESVSSQDEAVSASHPYTTAGADDVLAREQLKAGAHEISDAAADVVDSIGDAATLSFDDVAETARDLIRENPLVAIAAAAGIAYLIARITR